MYWIVFFFLLIILRQPRSTPTDTLVPHTTVFRSQGAGQRQGCCVGFQVAFDIPFAVECGQATVDLFGMGSMVAQAALDLYPHAAVHGGGGILRSEEHTSELQSLMRISSAVFCLKKKRTHNTPQLMKSQQP